MPGDAAALRAENARLREANERLRVLLEDKDAKIAELEERVARLERLISRNYLFSELPDISAAQTGYASSQPITEMSGISESPGRCGVVASLIPTETGHTGLNQAAAFSSLPIFDVSPSGP